MKIPDSVRIGGVDYKIQTVPNLREGVELLNGRIDYYNSVIQLSETDHAGHHARCITLWHEILHGIANHAEMDFGDSTEEHIINVLSRGIYQVLQDNESKLFDISKEGRNE